MQDTDEENQHIMEPEHHNADESKTLEQQVLAFFEYIRDNPIGIRGGSAESIPSILENGIKRGGMYLCNLYIDGVSRNALERGDWQALNKRLTDAIERALEYSIGKSQKKGYNRLGASIAIVRTPYLKEPSMIRGDNIDGFPLISHIEEGPSTFENTPLVILTDAEPMEFTGEYLITEDTLKVLRQKAKSMALMLYSLDLPKIDKQVIEVR